VDKRTARKTTIAAAFGITRQTVGTKIKKLIDLGLITEDDNYGLILNEIAPNKAFLIP
jgi:Mn-dependent DtxR family transcriptional regulator